MHANSHPPICSYEGSDYQERFWDQGDRAYEDLTEAIALRRLLPVRGSRVLELGAGAGRHSRRYERFDRVVLLDYARSQLQQAQRRLGEADRYAYVVADVYRLPFAPGCFDSATMIRTIHHLVEPGLALRQVRRVLASGATFILEFANKCNLKAILRWLTRRQHWNPFDKAPIEFAPLNYNFHPASVRAWLRAAQFGVRRQLTVSHFRLGWLKRLIPTRMLVAADSALQWSGAWIQWAPSVFVQSIADREL